MKKKKIGVIVGLLICMSSITMGELYEQGNKLGINIKNPKYQLDIGGDVRLAWRDKRLMLWENRVVGKRGSLQSTEDGWGLIYNGYYSWKQNEYRYSGTNETLGALALLISPDEGWVYRWNGGPSNNEDVFSWESIVFRVSPEGEGQFYGGTLKLGPGDGANGYAALNYDETTGVLHIQSQGKTVSENGYVNISGDIKAERFIGDGSLLTGISQLTDEDIASFGYIKDTSDKLLTETQVMAIIEDRGALSLNEDFSLGLAGNSSIQIGNDEDPYYTSLNDNRLVFHRDGPSYIDNENENGSIVLRSGGGNDAHLIVDKDGNVGIGTLSPSRQLEINGDDPDVYLNSTGTEYLTLFLGRDGQKAGLGLTPDNDFYIDRRDDVSWHPETFVIKRLNGNVGIGTNEPQYKLQVEGTIKADDLLLSQHKWADNVFEPGYELMPLESVERFVISNKHLPEVPSEADILKNGIRQQDINVLLIQKIEELTLHLIAHQKEINDLKAENAHLWAHIEGTDH